MVKWNHLHPYHTLSCTFDAFQVFLMADCNKFSVANSIPYIPRNQCACACECVPHSGFRLKVGYEKKISYDIRTIWSLKQGWLQPIRSSDSLTRRGAKKMIDEKSKYLTCWRVTLLLFRGIWLNSFNCQIWTYQGSKGWRLKVDAYYRLRMGLEPFSPC